MDHELTYKWIQDRLRDLHTGHLSAHDKARLEAIALDDPFVADALEGYETHPDQMHEAYLAALAEKIRHTPRERRRWLIPNLTVTAIAASVILIIATYAVISRMDPQEEKELTVVLNPDSLMTSDTALRDAVVWNEQSSDPTPAETGASTMSSSPAARDLIKTDGASSPSKESTGLASASGESAVGSAAKTTAGPPSTSRAQEEAVKNIPAEDLGESTGVVSEPAATDDAVTRKDTQAKRDEGFYANQMDPGRMASRVTGRIIDADTEEPILFARLLLSYTNEAFYSDINGYFELDLPEEEAAMQVQVTGYTDSLLTVRQGEEDLTLPLRTGAAIPPLKIIEYPSGAERTTTPDTLVSTYIEFIRYLHTSSQFPLTDSRQHAGRIVTVMFDVNRRGRPLRTEVTHSSGEKAYDDEAVRLIQNGPAWTCHGGQYPCTRRYTFCFQ